MPDALPPAARVDVQRVELAEPGRVLVAGGPGGGEAGEAEKTSGKSGDIDDLKRQLDEMKRKVDRLTGGST